MKTPTSEHGENMLWTEIVLNVRNNFCTQHVLPRFELGIFMYWTCNSMNNLSSYCGLDDAKIRASDKDLPVSTVCMEALLLKRSNICVLLWHFVLALKPSAFINQNGYRCHDYVLPFWLVSPSLVFERWQITFFYRHTALFARDEFELEFPVWSKPSYEGSEPSWGTSIFELKPSWQYWQNVLQKIANFYSYLGTTIKFPNFRPVSWL